LYTRFQLAKKYLHYYLTASNGKGHGVHSPFVFSFIRNVLNDTKEYPCYPVIELKRRELLRNETLIEAADYGAGSSVIKTTQRRVKDIAASSLKSGKFAQLLFRMAQYYKPGTILELGTSFGISTAYLASANNTSLVYSCEGAASIAGIARQNFNEFDLKNIHIIEGDFADTLPPLLSQLHKIDLAFVDGNHRKEYKLNYFHQLLNHSTTSSIFIFDDIHWSAGMEEAWEEIKQHRAVTLTIDLFFIGIIILSPDFNHKQQFSIRF
jgi:predicted O-methyltransferase YrrM